MHETELSLAFLIKKEGNIKTCKSKQMCVFELNSQSTI